MLACIVGLWVYADWGGDTYGDWWARRWAMLAILAGAVIYLEGLSAKILGAVRSRHEV